MKTCKCSKVYLNGGKNGEREVVGLNWWRECPEHGLKSAWYNSPEQRAVREKKYEYLRTMQARAKEARKLARNDAG